ncbi:hypothetical protein CYMTET_56566 [Cymbomonas tetramitiformis]|uniref:Uncharacterized protein n=1 Tax=Cymbomonas tetramitiformis TaxID=36881 RepID=A0AAE0BBV7_9CHLO|nr:hypothetical protein CYMTET_56566 [Cymbomonas tetramitiformis]
MGTSTRSHTAATRRSLVTIFDDATARHATTPATPTVAAAPAAQSAGAMFLDAVRRLAKESFDERAAKLVIKKVYDDRHGRFDGTESNVSSVFARLVLALRDIFVTEEAAFSSLFDLENATLPVRAEANKLLFSTLEYIFAPVSPAADWMESSADAHPPSGHQDHPVRPVADRVAAFNAALRSARRKSTLDDMEVKSMFIKSLNPVFYAPVVNRLLLHDQRAAESLTTIQQWVRECYAQTGTDSHVPAAARKYSALALTGQSDDEDYKTIFRELRDQLFDMKKEIKALHNRIDATKGFCRRQYQTFYLTVTVKLLSTC